MLQRFAIPSVLVSLVSIPAYVIGQRLRHGEGQVLLLTALTVVAVLLAGAILRQSERAS